MKQIKVPDDIHSRFKQLADNEGRTLVGQFKLMLDREEYYQLERADVGKIFPIPQPSVKKIAKPATGNVHTNKGKSKDAIFQEMEDKLDDTYATQEKVIQGAAAGLTKCPKCGKYVCEHQ